MAEGEIISGRSLSTASSFLDKMTELKYFYLLGILFFLLDNCLVLVFEKNIVNFEYRSDVAEQPISNAIIFVFLAFFLISLFFPMLRDFIIFALMKLYINFYLNLIDHIVDRLPFLLLFKFKESDSIDVKYLSDAEYRAIRDRDEFTLKRIDKSKSEFTFRKHILDLVFSFTCLLAINIWVVGSDNNQTINRKLNILFLNNYEGWGYIAHYRHFQYLS